MMKFLSVVRNCRYPTSSAEKILTHPLQRRYFQTDFVPRDPKAKPKRYIYPEVYNPYGPRPPPSEKIVQLADRMAALSPEELAQIGPALHEKLQTPEMEDISAGSVDMSSQKSEAAKPEEKKEKTAFSVKLEKFDAAAKIKVIKEVRAFTSLGLKEAKELVEKAPVMLKEGLPKEEAANILEKIKAAGGVAIME